MDEGVTVTHPNLRGVWTPTAPDGIIDSGYEHCKAYTYKINVVTPPTEISCHEVTPFVLLRYSRQSLIITKSTAS